MNAYETGDRVRLAANPADSRLNEGKRAVLEAYRGHIFTVTARFSDPGSGRTEYSLDSTGTFYWDGDMLEPAEPLTVTLEIPAEFAEDYRNGRFRDVLQRLSADAHLVAGNYEQETAAMLAKAFAESRPEKSGKGRTVYTRDRAAGILEPVEDLLCKYGVKIPSPEDNEREPDNEAAFYGSTYSDLLDGVEGALTGMLEDAGVTDYISGEFSGNI